MTAPLGRDEVDGAIVALVAAHDRISAAMYAVDNHPGRTALDVPGLTGYTQRFVADLRAAIDVLWSRFNALGASLEQVRTVRAQRAKPGDSELAELTVLLRAPVIPIGPDGMVPDGAAPPGAVRLPLMELARQAEAGVADAVHRLTTLDSAMSGLAAAFGPVAEALTRLRERATGLGPEDAPVAALDRLDARLADAQREAFADPLAVVPGAPGEPALRARLAEVTTGADAARAEVAALASLADTYPERADRLRAAIAGVEAAEDAAARACAVANEKIVNTGLPAVPDADPGLRAHLAQLDQLFRERRWGRLATELAAAERAAAAGLQRAEQLKVAADGLLDRRTELRGRLDAYRAKAARMGFAEHAGLAERHRAAEDLLYVSPCDLPAATRALVAYQRYLNELSERG
ncbi:hypothetical protein [Rhizomonospora bruguierae]|uniref:hypothetical protein n=1 Tax=Rhizomonospora bruguierae TaxID=1581705 RepID=UPI001BCF9767|nr:hypothetical protein [Micromonospora sp. NBRC 107566]